MMILADGGTIVMEGAVEFAKKDNAGGSFCIFLGMRSGNNIRIPFESLEEREKSFELMANHLNVAWKKMLYERAYWPEYGRVMRTIDAGNDAAKEGPGHEGGDKA